MRDAVKRRIKRLFPSYSVEAAKSQPARDPRDPFRIYVDRLIERVYEPAYIRNLCPAGRPDVLLVMVAWGERYVQTFLNVGLPMLLNAQNMPALVQGKRVLLRVFTDEPSRQKLEASPLLARLRQQVDVSYEVVAQELLRRRPIKTWDDKAVLYGHFGGLTHIGIHEAIALEADLIFIWPDQIIGPGSYAYLRRLMDDEKVDCMAVRAINVNHTGFVEELDKYRAADGVLSPTIEQLVGLVSRCIRDESVRFFLRSMDMRILAGFNYLIIASPNGMVVRQANPDPVYISKRVLKRDLDFDFNPPDGRLLSLLFPIPQAWDRLNIPARSKDYFCVDVSDENSPGLDLMPAGPLTQCLENNLRGGWTGLQRNLFHRKTVMTADSPPAWAGDKELLTLEAMLDTRVDNIDPVFVVFKKAGAVTTVESYNRSEKAAKGELTTPEISAFSTVTFDYVGVRSRVGEERELRHYVDGWTEPSIKNYFTEKFFPGPYCFNSFSAYERDIFGRVSRRIGEFTKERFGREIRPLPTLLAQTGLFRIVMALRALMGLERISTFEVGPGNGYLGSLLAMAGQAYASTDNCQALYLWQSRALEAIAPGELNDWASEGPPPYRNRLERLPWWDFVRLRTDCPLSADIVVANSCLGEMSNNALLYTVRIARQMLRRSRTPGFFLYTSTGWTHVNSAETIAGALRAAGFRRVCGQFFQLYALEGRPIPPQILELDRQLFVLRNQELGAQAIGWEGAHDLSLVPIAEALEYKREYASDDLELAEFLGMLDVSQYFAK